MWKVADIWNEIAQKENRPPQKRGYVYASEIKYPIIDRYLKMVGMEPTNPPNDRALRKFWTGNFFEEAVRAVLVVAGIYKAEEIVVNTTPYSDTLDVHGRLDFIAGGYIDPEEIAYQVGRANLPQFLQPMADKYIEMMAGQTIPKRIIEVKSVSVYAYDYIDRKKRPLDTHHAQAYHYSKGTGLPASICYICKDHSMMKEYFINELEAEAAYRDDLVKITHYYRNREMPPIEPLLFFDPAIAKFTKNLGVEYSNYLTYLYGYKNPDEYRRSVEPSVLRWNNALNRWAASESGKTTPTGRPIVMTPANKQAIVEIKANGYDTADLLRQKMEIIDNENIDED